MTDAQQALAQVREALAAGPTPGPWKIRAERYRFIHVYATGGGICHLDTVDGEGAANAKLITAASPDNITALLDRLAEADEMRNVLIGNGFVKCDISACNCGSWHHRYGLPERMQKIEDALAEAGHELSNANGHLPINALKALVAERDDLRRQLAEAEQDARRYRWLRANREFCVAAYPEGEWVIPAGMVFLGYSNPDADSWIDAAMGASNE